ncbi:RNA polymerase sigma-70 factor [uncultured Bacteroides sp.]|jgi:RNA polymerase sigma factor, sigma-70 family/RNA polymerase sigma-70 factor, Bacteroides expansion family 1|uniref:RNA polymerase sigma-70 factor n=1 Tax=uncultured Bacteroides sp. TaxID=162156 RepID=UPI002676875D|nr:RNA polymerase sigma-70 factor [uncultured Bacteroides sp.]
MEEKLILDKIKVGDAAAFAVLYDCYWLKVYNFAQLYITSSSEVSEVVQDVFVKVWETKETIDIEKNFDGLLFMITRNIIFNYSRRYFNELNFRMTALRGIESSYNMEDELDAADLKIYIDKLIAQLPPKRQQIFRMSREEHLSNKEIAERCAISEKAVERQITLALKFIKDNLPLFIVFLG